MHSAEEPHLKTAMETAYLTLMINVKVHKKE